MFGLFMIKHYIKEMKQYVIIFACLSSRVMHLEVVQNMETCSEHGDLFIQTLRRFIARRGSIKLVRCNNGSNFACTKSELQSFLSEMNENKISHLLQNTGTDWVTSKNNSPLGGHMGEVWVCQIKSTRVLLSALLKIMLQA